MYKHTTHKILENSIGSLKPLTSYLGTPVGFTLSRQQWILESNCGKMRYYVYDACMRHALRFWHFVKIRKLSQKFTPDIDIH